MGERRQKSQSGAACSEKNSTSHRGLGGREGLRLQHPGKEARRRLVPERGERGPAEPETGVRFPGPCPARVEGAEPSRNLGNSSSERGPQGSASPALSLQCGEGGSRAGAQLAWGPPGWQRLRGKAAFLAARLPPAATQASAPHTLAGPGSSCCRQQQSSVLYARTASKAGIQRQGERKGHFSKGRHGRPRPRAQCQRGKNSPTPPTLPRSDPESLKEKPAREKQGVCAPLLAPLNSSGYVPHEGHQTQIGTSGQPGPSEGPTPRCAGTAGTPTLQDNQ